MPSTGLHCCRRLQPAVCVVATRMGQETLEMRSRRRSKSINTSLVTMKSRCTCLLLLLLTGLQVISRVGAEELPYNISEEEEEGTFIANIKKDANLESRHPAETLAQVKFRFLSPPKVSFHLEEDTGVLRTGQRIDRDEECPMQATCEYMLDVVALIPSTMTFLEVIKVRVVITDLNDNWPQFPEAAISQDILESATLGTSIVVPTATDPDSTAYSIRDYVLEGESSPFKLELREKLDGSVEVRLILEKPLDREQKDRYEMKVVAHDGGEKTGSIDVNVRVLDANDNDPVFDNETYEVTIFENVPLQTTILNVHASDPDSGSYGQVVYGFSPQTLSSYHHLFGIDEESGNLYIKGMVDFEEGAVYHLFVTAHDQGPDARTSDTTVIVRVMDINDHAPDIKVNTLSESGTDSAEISEDATADTFVAHITVTDPDSGNNGRFNCTLNDDHFRLQQLYVSEYKVVTQAPLDRESRSEYNLAITCRDSGTDQQVSIKHLTVIVTDVNDNAPVFGQSRYTANLIENNLIGTYITQVNATDRDIGPNAAVTYILEEDVRGLFYIDPTSGIITARVTFDHEQTQRIPFQVTAVDRGDPPKSSMVLVVVTVNDLNDEVPRFSQPSYSFGVYENEPEGTEVGIVHAVDADSEPHNQFDLAFLPHQKSEEVFSIDDQSGKISTKSVLDREDQGVYHLVVMAIDRATPPMTSTVTVSVYVADRNDNAPLFEYPTAYNNTVHISNRSPIGYRVTRVRATDKDIGKNANVSYTLGRGNGREQFVVNAVTGSVMVNADLRGISYQTFSLELIAQDGGSPEQTAVASLNIVVNKSIGYPLKESPLMIGQNFTIVISLACISGLVVVILILAIVCIRRQDSHRRNRKAHKAHAQQQKRLAQTPTSNDQLTMFSKIPNGGLENSACVKSQDDVKILVSTAPERKNSSKKINNQRQQQQQQQQQAGSKGSDISTITPAHSSALDHSPALASGSAPAPTHRPESGPWALAQKELEVHQLLHLLKKEGDADSTSSGEGSNTDSGRGPSEEGDRDHNHSRDHHNQSRDSQGGRRAERAAAAAAARGRPPQEATSPTGRGVTPLVSPARDTSKQQRNDPSYFRDGTQMTTFNPRSSSHRDPRAPPAAPGSRPPSSSLPPSSASSSCSDPRSPRSPPDGHVYHAAPTRTLPHPPPPCARTPYLHPAGAATLVGAVGGHHNHQHHAAGAPYSIDNKQYHQLPSKPSNNNLSAGYGLNPHHHHQQQAHHAQSARALAAAPTSTGSSSFRPHDVPLTHSASRDNSSSNVLSLNNGSEPPYSKDVVV